MAYFAKLDSGNKVANVIVVDDSRIDDKAFWSNFDGRWVQVEAQGEFKVPSAGIGDIYRDDVDAFQPMQPYASWIFREDTWEWEPPVPMPASIGPWGWNETSNSWDSFNDS